MASVFIVHKVDTLDPRSLYKQGRSLRTAGHEVTVCMLGEGERIVEGMRVVGFDRGGGRVGKFLGVNWDIFRFLWKARPDVCHNHDMDFLPGLVVLKVCRGIKVIYDVHEAYPEYMMLKSYIPSTVL